MSIIRPAECERNIIIFKPSEVKLNIFLKKYKIKALKFIL